MVLCDNLDLNLGAYFSRSEMDFYDFINEQTCLIKNYEQIYSNQANLDNINLITSKYNNKPFIVISYTHGAPTKLSCNGVPLVYSSNTHLFANSLFYSTACLVGRQLAYELINNGCKTFVGFKEESLVPVNEEYHTIFINCENYALKMFLLMNVTIGDAFNSMKNYMNQQIDKLIEIYGDPICASFLNANKEAFICIGDTTIKKEDMFS